MANVSAVSICSNALLLLGDKPIDSFDVNNDRTRLAANLYPQKRDRVLRAHPWNCAVKRVVLSPSSTDPAFGWKYQFQLPGDWLRTLNVGDDDSADDYAIEGRMILSNAPTCSLRYIFRNTAESTWDALLIDAMTQVMVAAFTYPITKSTTKQATEEEIVRRMLKEARSVDGQEGTPEVLGDFPLLSNRMR
jgi:hypothetical protein